MLFPQIIFCMFSFRRNWAYLFTSDEIEFHYCLSVHFWWNIIPLLLHFWSQYCQLFRIIFLLRYHYDACYFQVHKLLVPGCVWQLNFVVQYLWVLSMELALYCPFGAWEFWGGFLIIENLYIPSLLDFFFCFSVWLKWKLKSQLKF